AFIMYNHFEASRVLRVAQYRQRRVCTGIVGMNLFDDHVGALSDTLFEDVFLVRIIMATTPGNEQDLNRVRCRQDRYWRQGGQDQTSGVQNSNAIEQAACFHKSFSAIANVTNPGPRVNAAKQLAPGCARPGAQQRWHYPRTQTS